MADTTTTNLGLTKPEVGASSDTWGGKINTNLDLVDGIFAAAGSGTSVGLNVGTGKTLTVGGTQNMSALTASTALALDSSKNIVSVTNTGTGNNVLSASPTLTGTISAAAQTLSGNLTLSGGTANGVLYLNGSKVATSGSALSFDGSYFTAASGTGTFLADIVQVSGTATKVNANGVGLEFRGGSTPNITSYSRVGSAYLPMTLDTSESIFSISGTEGFRLTSSTLYTASGINVGIGTSSPSYRFQAVRSGDGITAGISGGTYGIRFDNGGTFSSGASTIHGVDSTLVGSYQQLNLNGSVLTFQTAATERARIPADGGFQCLTSISVGNATPTTSGAGITFPATQSASSNANTLDDYEEGTWTPSVIAGSISGTNITYNGVYTKIGRVVIHNLIIETSVNDLVVGSYVGFSGLPFSVVTQSSGSVTTEDIDSNTRNGFASVGGTTMTLGPCGSATGTQKLAVTVVGYI